MNAALVLILSAAIPALAGAAPAVPEPGTLLLVGGGLGAAILIARRQRSRNKK